MDNRRTHLVLTILLFGLLPQANADEVILSCDTSLRWAFIGPPGETGLVVLEGQNRTKQEIDTGKLTEYSPPDQRGDVRRIKSKTTTRTCGPFTVVFSSGWFNSNPLGEMGEPEFPVFEISLDRKRVLGPIALGSCSNSGLVWNRCAANWATSVTLGWNEKNNKGHFELNRTYSERLEWP